MHFSNFLNFRPLNNSLELWIIFSWISLPKGMFWQNKKKNSIFCECLSILDILRKWLLKTKTKKNIYIYGTKKLPVLALWDHIISRQKARGLWARGMLLFSHGYPERQPRHRREFFPGSRTSCHAISSICTAVFVSFKNGGDLKCSVFGFHS